MRYEHIVAIYRLYYYEALLSVWEMVKLRQKGFLKTVDIMYNRK